MKFFQLYQVFLLRHWCVFVAFAFLANSALSLESATISQWPHLRGENYDAVADAVNLFIPTEESETPILWKTTVGQGYSGSVIVDGRLYTQAQSRSGQFVICLDAVTGSLLWQTRYGWPYELDGNYPGTYGTPTYLNGKLYFTGCYGTAGCMDALSGKIIWSFDLKKRFNTEVPSFGYACTPLVKNGKVYLTLNGDVNASVIALNANDGSTVWQSGSFAGSYSSPLPFSYGKKKMIVSFLRNYLIANDPETGTLLWKVKFSDGYDEHSTWPLFKDNMIFCASPFFKGMRGLKIETKKDDQSDSAVTQLWHTKTMSNDIFSSVLYGRYIYGFDITDPQANPECNTDGFFKCLDAYTGKQLWETPATGHVHTLIAGDKLILLTEDGTLIYANASSEKYSELWRGRIFTEKRCWTLPAIWNGRIYVRGGDEIISLALRENLILKEKPFTMTIPVISIVGSINNYLKQYKTEDFIAPSLALCLLWFIYSILIFAFAAPLLRFGGKYSFGLFTASSIILGGALSLPLSTLHNRFIFTLPLVLFSSFIFLLKFRQDQLKRENKIIPRVVLGVFIVITLLYFYLCNQLFITSGLAFPFGLILSFIPAVIFMKLMKEPGWIFAKFAIFFLGFALYFWSAVALIIFRVSIGWG